MEMDMYLYHGTSMSNYYSIIKEGLKPRANNSGNFNYKSNSELVYLTNNFNTANHYALRSCIANDCDSCLILQVELDSLDIDKLRVDENFIAIEELGQFVNVSLETRINHINKASTDNRWKKSLDAIGLMTYMEKIPFDDLKIISEFPREQNMFYREEFYQYVNPVSNCAVYDHFLSNYTFDYYQKEWVYKTPEGWKKVLDFYSGGR